MVIAWIRRVLPGTTAALLALPLAAGLAAATPAQDQPVDTGNAADAAVEAPQDAATEDGGDAAAVDAPGVSAAQRAQRAWEQHGRPARLIIVRAGSVDTVEAGRLTREVPRAPGVVTLAELAGSTPAGWVTTGPPAARISAAVLLAPRVVLNLHGAGPTVQLAGGPTAGDAASLHTGTGQLAAHGITVISVDPATGEPMAAGPGRPFVSVGAGGRLLATDTTFADLGSTATGEAATDPAAAIAAGRPGVGFATGSNGSLVRSTLLRNTIGLRLSGSSAVRLERVLVADSLANGLVLRGDRGTKLIDVRAERNSGNGVLVSGPSTDRPISGISTIGNGRFGLAVLGQAAPRIVGVSTRADRAGGLQLSGGSDVSVSGFTAVDQPIGVLAHVGATRIGLGDLRITGGERGVVVDKTTQGVRLTGSRIERTGIAVAVAGRGVQVNGVAIVDSRSALRIERGAGDVSAIALTVTGGQDGVVVGPGTAGVVLRDLVTDRVANSGVRTAGPNVEIVGGRIGGGQTGITADAATSIRGVQIGQVDVGIRVRSRHPVTARAVVVSAASSGVAVEPGGRVVLTDSTVEAAEAVQGTVDLVGHNSLSLPPLNTLGIIGVPLVLLALVLDQIQRARARRRPG